MDTAPGIRPVLDSSEGSRTSIIRGVVVVGGVEGAGEGEVRCWICRIV